MTIALTLLVAFLSLAVAVISTLLLARQTRAATAEAEITSNLAGVEALGQAIAHLHNVHMTLVDRPELRQYFYDNVPMPDDELELSRILTIAEMLGDCVESAIESSTYLRPSQRHLEDWTDYATFLLVSSPVVRHVLATHPLWYPFLDELSASIAIR
jgi:hypothetical protein